MPKVTFLPVNMTIDAEDGASILDVALDNDVPIQHACGGFCACTTCHVHIKEGLDQLEPMDEEEKERIESVDRLHDSSRLACQAKVIGDVTVEIQNLDA